MGLNCRVCLNYREAEARIVERGISQTPEAVRDWCLTFGQPQAKRLRTRHSRPKDRWHLDAVLLTFRDRQTLCRLVRPR
jgi:putative transposase